MATFTIGGGQSGNISPFLTGKATPMSLPPGSLAEAGRQAAGLQKGIAGVGADIGDAIIARAKEEELKKEGLAILMADNERMKKYFPAIETKTSEAANLGITSPQELTTQLVDATIKPDLQAFEQQAVDMHQIAAPPKTIQPNPLEEILGGEAWEKVTSGNISKGELRGYLHGVNNWKEEKYREVVDEMNRMKRDAMKKVVEEDKAMAQAASLLSPEVPGYTETSMQDVIAPKGGIEAALRKAAQDKEMSLEEFNLLERAWQTEGFEPRVPKGIKGRAIEEQESRRKDINRIMGEWLGLKPIDEYSQSVQAGLVKVYDNLPEGLMGRAERGTAGAKGAVKRRFAEHLKEKGEGAASPHRFTEEDVARWDLLHGRRPTSKSDKEIEAENELNKAMFRYESDEFQRHPQWAKNDLEARIRKLKFSLGQMQNKRAKERIILDAEGNPLAPQPPRHPGGQGTITENILTEEITGEDISGMNPEDQALYADLDKPLYTGDDRVIGEEEITWDVPSRSKSNAEMRKEMETFLREGNQWSPAMKKRLDDYMPEFAPGELKPATLNGMALPGFLYDPIGKKYIEISTNEPIEFNEIQTKLAAYRNLMKSAQRDVDEILAEDAAYDPASAFAYWQKVGPDYLTSAKGKEYEAAAGRWIEGRLRFATGAQAPAAEYLKDWRNFFPVPGDSERAIDRKKRSRDEVYRTLSKVLGAGRTSYLDEGAPVLPPAGAAGGTSGKFSFQGGELKLNK